MPIHGYPGGVISATPPTVDNTTASGVWTTEKQLQYQAQGLWPMAVAQPISRSLRFNSADSAYLSRTVSVAGNRKTWTWSGWCKFVSFPDTTLGSDQRHIFFTGNQSAQSATTYFRLMLDGKNRLSVDNNDLVQILTTSVYRDFSAWYHIVVAFDTTQATASNRMKLYVNGVQVTAFDTAGYPTQNTDYGVNQTAYPFYIGSEDVRRFYGGYMTEINFIDGQALTPSSFGQTNSITGVWEPKPYTGTYGTNGFYLNFSDNSGTTSTTLGKDYSGNGNNWTPNNFSVTAGTGNDSLVDSPTSYGTDTGAGGTVRGNYCTWNPLAKGSDATLTNGNLDVAFGSGGSTTQQTATFGMSSGKWYWEATITASSASPTYAVVGITTKSFGDNEYPGYTATSWGYRGSDGQKWNNTAGSSYGATFTTNDVIGIAFDADAGTLTFYKNGASQGTAYSSLAAGTYYPAIGDQSSTQTFTAATNFGQRPFAYTAPSGFKALCTQNLSTPTVVQGDDYFNTVLYTGNGSTQSITGVGFQPDFVWNKARSAAYSNRLADVLRGATNLLNTDSTGAAFTDANSITSFNADGFSVGNSFDNTNAVTYVAWNWKANGAGSTNTAGSITSTVSANTTSGFSVVTYTGNGTGGATVGHGLGAVPQMMIVRDRNNVNDWVVYHVSTGNGTVLVLNSASGTVTPSSGYWNNTTPGSSTFTVGTVTNVNGSSRAYVAYCFAAIPGYSAFGSYTGNGSTDGPFVYTGFRPRWLMLKATSGTTFDWGIFDTARDPYNVTDLLLRANTSGAEQTDTLGPSDLLSNGFKFRGPASSFGFNVSGTTYIYAAFAENPFKYALAR